MLFIAYSAQICCYSLILNHTTRRESGYEVAYVDLTKTSFEKNCFSAWASTLNMGFINKVDMVCLSPVGYGV